MTGSKTALRNQRKHANRKERRDAQLRADLPRLESWVFSVDSYGDGVLRGSVYNKRGYKDGTHVQTSPLLSCGHIFAVTLTGSKYLLGAPSEEYVAFRERHGFGPISHKVFHFELCEGDKLI